MPSGHRTFPAHAALQAGFSNDELFPKRGTPINFTVNGVARLVRGENFKALFSRMNLGMVSYVYGGVEMLPNTIPLPSFWSLHLI